MVKPKKTLEEIRATGNARAKRYQQSQREMGKKHLTVLVSQDAMDIITRQRQRTGATVSKVVESAIMVAYGDPEPEVFTLTCEPVDYGNPEPELTPETAPEPPAPETIVDQEPMVDPETEIADYHGKALSLDEKGSILIKVVELYPGRKNARKRADVLKKAGVPRGKGKAPWDSKSVMDAYRNALKRQGQPTLI